MHKFTAKQDEICCKCGKNISKDQPITWTRTKPPVYYHPDCLGHSNPADKPGQSFTEKVTRVDWENKKAREHVNVKELLDSESPAEKATRADWEHKLRVHALVGASQEEMFDYSDSDLLDAPPAKLTMAELPTPSARPLCPTLKVEKWKENEWWVSVQALSQVVSRVLVVGPPGVGKSWLVNTIAPKVYKIICHEEMTEAYLLGSWRLQNKETVWVDGLATKAMREGVPLILHEIERSSAEAKSSLYSIMDSPASVTLPTGECVEAATGYKVLATSNELPDSLPPAICDRIDATVFATMPHPDIVKGWDKDIKELTLAYYKKLPQTESMEYKPSPTTRHAIAFQALLRAGIERECAGVAVYCSAWKEISSIMGNLKATETAKEEAK